ncbi:MAG: cob(I)yrinic acid a,c-diamide adenosyltransferase [Crocinitomicaceae bacterium]|nr:cob(I)yrinic acid a,c-diamide adenosyltransferase [Crocinitomicaceae bacterium]
MKIYTKKGDQGETSLIGGVRVKKHELRIDAYGTVDELNSHVGLLRDQEGLQNFAAQLIEIQDRLFTMGSHLASHPEKSKMELPEFKKEDVDTLEAWIDEMDQTLPEMRSFILPGGHPSVSICHINRCVCRRAERICVLLAENEQVSPILIQYLNRLSDYFFVLSRKISQDLGAKETPWKPKY